MEASVHHGWAPPSVPLEVEHIGAVHILRNGERGEGGELAQALSMRFSLIYRIIAI